jgi:sodium transport system permease protein
LGGAYFVIDTTAGERERESLESLLLVPVPASHIMLGKVFAAVLFAITMISVALVAFKISFEFAPNLLKEMSIGWGSVFMILLFLAPVAVLGVALLTLLSANAKSVKEAQSYMSMLMLLPVLPTLVLMINPVKTETWMYAVPFLSQNQLVMAVLRGEALSALEVSVYLLSQVSLVCVILFAAAKLYASERMALGR